MNTTYITATDLKKRTAEILSTVHYKKWIAVIERHGRAIAKLVPVEKETKKVDIKTLSEKYYGIAPDFPDVTSLRHFRKRVLKI